MMEKTGRTTGCFFGSILENTSSAESTRKFTDQIKQTIDAVSCEKQVRLK